MPSLQWVLEASWLWVFPIYQVASRTWSEDLAPNGPLLPISISALCYPAQWNSAVTPRTTYPTWCTHLQVAPPQTKKSLDSWSWTLTLWARGRNRKGSSHRNRGGRRKGQMLHKSLLPLTKEIHSHREAARLKTENFTVAYLGFPKTKVGSSGPPTSVGTCVLESPYGLSEQSSPISQVLREYSVGHKILRDSLVLLPLFLLMARAPLWEIEKTTQWGLWMHTQGLTSSLCDLQHYVTSAPPFHYPMKGSKSTSFMKSPW